MWSGGRKNWKRGEGQADGGKVFFVVTRGKWIDSVVTNDNGWGGV